MLNKIVSVLLRSGIVIYMDMEFEKIEKLK